MEIKMGAITLDSDNSESLSDFYRDLLGWSKHRIDAEWIVVYSDKKEGTPMVFQQVEDYERPVWPAKSGSQQQMLHLDFYVDDVEQAVAHAISCGAQMAGVQLDDGWRVLLDPAGHPFCIIPNIEPDQAE